MAVLKRELGGGCLVDKWVRGLWVLVRGWGVGGWERTVGEEWLRRCRRRAWALARACSRDGDGVGEL